MSWNWLDDVALGLVAGGLFALLAEVVRRVERDLDERPEAQDLLLIGGRRLERAGSNGPFRTDGRGIEGRRRGLISLRPVGSCGRAATTATHDCDGDGDD